MHVEHLIPHIERILREDENIPEDREIPPEVFNKAMRLVSLGMQAHAGEIKAPTVTSR